MDNLQRLFTLGGLLAIVLIISLTISLLTDTRVRLTSYSNLPTVEDCLNVADVPYPICTVNGYECTCNAACITPSGKDACQTLGSYIGPESFRLSRYA